MNRMNRMALIMFGVGIFGTVSTFSVLWYEGNNGWVLAGAGLASLGIAFLVYRGCKLVFPEGRLAFIPPVMVVILLGAAIVAAPLVTDRKSSWNESVRAIRALRGIVEENRKYAPAHGGSFAFNLPELHQSPSVGHSYTIEYEPEIDPDHTIHHYKIRANPSKTYWISVYTDETGVIRINENGPADRNSREVL